MQQSSLWRPSAFPAAIFVAAVFMLGLLASSAAAAAPATGLDNPAASPVATASTPASAITSATDSVVDGNDVSTGAGAVANPNDDGGGTAPDPNGGGGTADPGGGGGTADPGGGGGTANPGGGGGTADPGSGPAFPGVHPLQATAMTVTVGWFDRSTDEQKFVLYRRDAHGAFQEIYEVPTRNMAGFSGDYSYVDTDRSLSGQCYAVAAVDQNGVAGYTKEECTVRPDPSSFPQTVPEAVQQWGGLSNVNDGPADLWNEKRVEDQDLRWSHQTFGIDLGWSTHSLWKVEAQGGPHLMRGQPVALYVWGGGWLTYGHQTWGIDLKFSDTPVYEWYALGGTPGIGIAGGNIALWNSDRGDYLVYHHRTFGVDLDWYQNTLPPPPPPPPAAQGVKTYIAYNCISEERPLEMWIQDLTAGTPFVDMGRLDTQWSDSDHACPRTGQPWTFTPTPGHEYLFRAVDYSDTFFGCTNDPLLAGCWRAQRVFVGDANGVVVNDTLG